MSNDCFRLKGSVITTFILEFNDYDPDKFKQQLHDKVNSSPEFFNHSPVIIDFSKLDQNTTDINYSDILTICRSNGLQPVAFRHSNNLNISAANETNLAVLEHKTTQTEKEKVKTEPKIELTKTAKVIHKPIRSGQQVYADGCDLIILGSVSGGAEVLADGNIHIYGSLRGRALAGVKGDNNARVFCTNNEAELVSIAGHFLLNESLESQQWNQPAQFFLEDETLHVGSL